MKGLLKIATVLLILLSSCLYKDWTEHSRDVVTKVLITEAGSFYIAGTTDGNMPGFKNNDGDEDGRGGITDIYIIRLNSSGNLEMLLQDGIEGADSLNSIEVDSQGNIYAIGSSFWKFDKDGNRIWRKIYSGHDLKRDGQDNVFVILDLSTAYALAKFNKSDDIVWIKILDRKPSSISLGEDGYVYLSGVGQDPLITTETKYEIFIIKYDTDGNEIWTESIGDLPAKDILAKVVSDKTGSVYLGGYTSVDIENEVELENNLLYLAKYDSSGALQWLMQHGNGDQLIPYDLSIDASGNIFFSGSVSGDIDGLSNEDTSAFVTVYDSSGSRLNTYLIEGSPYSSMSIDSKGNLLLGGTGESAYYYVESDIQVRSFYADTLEEQWAYSLTSEPTSSFIYTSKLADE